ncbi:MULTISPECIES: hypothetical protein [unclassified Thioclava]|uniref:hypothetical protein n=1 Tax=unclassified Thioclava TaxID=2621713 RepID=UPI00143BDFD7|nr:MULTISPECIES: hypothetical protein [unclassified Thioclava]
MNKTQPTRRWMKAAVASARDCDTRMPWARKARPSQTGRPVASAPRRVSAAQ